MYEPVDNFTYRRLFQVLCYNITSGCMGLPVDKSGYLVNT